MVILFAILLSGMALLSYYWQQYTQLDLLSFALGVMAFAYAPLLGVYAAAIFTQRGSEEVIPYALLGGLLMVLLCQPYVIGMLGYKVDFSVMMMAGMLVSFLMMMTRSQNEQ
jgi:Na+/proline symporter